MATELFTGVGDNEAVAASAVGLTDDDTYLVAAADAPGTWTLTDLGGADSITIEVAAHSSLSYDLATETWTQDAGDDDVITLVGLETVTFDNGTLTSTGGTQRLVDTTLDAGSSSNQVFGATSSILEFDGNSTSDKSAAWDIESVEGQAFVASGTVAVTGGTLAFGADADADAKFTPDASQLTGMYAGQSQEFEFDVVYDDVTTTSAADATITYTLSFSKDPLPSADTYIGSAADDGTSTPVNLLGGNDSAWVFDGDDFVDGGAGDDAIAGGAGVDTLNGGVGDDKLYGGVGDDILDGGAGDDVLFGQGGDDTLTGTSGTNTLIGGGGADDITGGSGDDSIFAGSGDDVVADGGGGADTMYLGAGDDVVTTGGAGTADIFGGAGNDDITAADGGGSIDGGAGDDTMTAAADVDTFIFAGQAGLDTINGFTTTTDKIDLSAFDIATLGLSKADVYTKGLTLDASGADNDSLISIGGLEVHVLDATIVDADILI